MEERGINWLLNEIQSKFSKSEEGNAFVGMLIDCGYINRLKDVYTNRPYIFSNICDEIQNIDHSNSKIIKSILCNKLPPIIGDVKFENPMEEHIYNILAKDVASISSSSIAEVFIVKVRSIIDKLPNGCVERLNILRSIAVNVINSLPRKKVTRQELFGLVQSLDEAIKLSEYN